ncbi:MAG: undecaprenyl-diphosphate phosphatase [Succinivibrio sp.]
MTLTHIFALALIQGLTEFLPVSSSAHLILPSQILGWPDQGLGFDVAVHVGTLAAVCIYYFRDLLKIAMGAVAACLGRGMGTPAKVGFCMVVATIPAALAGMLFEAQISTMARSIRIIAWTTIAYGLLLGAASLANRRFLRTDPLDEGSRPDSLSHLTWGRAVIIGLAQALALVPGTSRSGITLTAGLFLGMRPQSAARFSFLLSVPVILASAVLEGHKLIANPELSGASAGDMLLGAAISFVAALAVIHFFMKFIAKSGMAVFVIYRLALGAALLAFIAEA